MISKLITDSQIEQGDDFYQELIDLYRDKSEKQCRLISSKLILLLSNHIGDKEVLQEAFTIAGKITKEEDKA